MITHGIRRNLGQFILLVITNAFVGGMVGLERTILPLVAEREFGIASKSAILTFLISFGIVKALTNVSAGYLAGVSLAITLVGGLTALSGIIVAVLMTDPSNRGGRAPRHA